MNNDATFPVPGENHDEEYNRKMKKLVNSLKRVMEETEKEMVEAQRLDAIMYRFIDNAVNEIQLITTDYFPEFVPQVAAITDDLRLLLELRYRHVEKLCKHYQEGNAGYFDQLYLPEYNIVTWYNTLKERTNHSRCKKQIELALLTFEEEYVEDFYFKNYLKSIHRLLKKLLPLYLPQIFDLTSQGFRELDGFLYIVQIEIYDCIREATPDSAPGFTDSFIHVN